MKKRLSRNTLAELKEWARTREFPRGYETNRDHENCPAGEDKRSRLYYKITDDGKMLLAHCFNCGWSEAHFRAVNAIADFTRHSLLVIINESL